MDLDQAEKPLFSRGSCAIDDGDSVILTGGFEGEKTEEGEVLKRVSRYDLTGLVEELPEMSSERAHHACAGYTDPLYFTKVFVVAGGFPLTAEAEMLMEGYFHWQYVPPLPVPVTLTSGFALNNIFYVLGQIDQILERSFFKNIINVLGGSGDDEIVQ